MCGLVGWFQRPGNPVDPVLLARMAAEMRHRGPDDEGQWVEGSAGLHHLRLSVIDLQTGHQPMEAGPAVIAYNGEIYNYLELREELRREGAVFRTASDTEVLIQGYLRHGADILPRLNGMFAFVLVDRARGKVLAARDFFGVKPLYVHATPDRVIFASEIKAILRHPAVEARCDFEALQDYWTFQFVLHEETLFAGIQKVLPGQYLEMDLRDLSITAHRYWDPCFRVDRHHTEEYFRERIRETLLESVRLQMRSDVPVGTYLSGGVDSSLVTVLAARHAGDPLKTFTGAFSEGEDFDETPYAEAVAREVGARSFVVRPTEREFVEAMPRLIWHMDEPAAGPGLFPQWATSRLARQEVTVALGGQGGDEIFHGYIRYVVAYLEQALKGSIQGTLEEGEHIVTLKSILPNLPFLRQYVPMLQDFWSRGLFEDMDRRYFRLLDRSGGTMELLAGDVLASWQPEGTFARFQKVFHHPDTRSYINKMTHFDLVAGLPALLHVEDRVSMAHSLESRVPLLDRRLVDLVAAMPPAMKFRGAEPKYALRAAVGDLIPEVVRNRKDKKGFPVPLHLWARRGPVRDFFRDVLLSRAARDRGMWNLPAIEALLDREHAFGRRLWGILNLELWFQTFLDAPRTGR